jgi:DNA-binding transcriptional LysR family regulator
MTLVQLKHFIALAMLGSYVKASKALFLTQPALSRSIQALEEELGHPVFDRIGRRIELTAMGRQFLPRAKSLVSDADALKTLGKRMQAGSTGVIRIGLSSGPGALLSVPMMLHMVSKHPLLHFEVSRGNTGVLIQALREGQLDAAIVDTRSVRPSADLRISEQVEMTAGFMCRRGHPLLAKKKPVSLEELRAYPIASTPLSDEVARILTQRYGPQASPDELITLRCDDSTSLVEVAKTSNTIVLTIDAVGHSLAKLPTRPAFNGTARFGMVTLEQRAEVPGLAIVRSLLQTLLPEEIRYP